VVIYVQPLVEISNDLSQFLQSVHHIRKIGKGTFLYQEGLPANEVFIIQSGKIKISKITPDGRELTLRLCSTGELIGELSMFYPASKYLLNAKVIESGEVAVIYKDELERRLEIDSRLAIEFMRWESNQNRKMQTKFRDLVLHGKKGAVCSTLIRLTNSYGQKTPNGILIDLPLTNQELANFCGTSREVVNRMLSDLRKNHVLSVDKGIITIHDLNYLKMEINCENCPKEICNIE
jgi:CRP-like cAMP-binding protein